jgi:hypothetical protein
MKGLVYLIFAITFALSVEATQCIRTGRKSHNMTEIIVG